MKDKATAAPRIEELKAAPPKNLQHLYASLLEEIKVIRREIASLEREFYGNRTPVEFLKSWGPVIKSIMSSHNLSEMNSLRQIQSVIFLSRDPDVQEMYPNVRQITKEECDKLSRLQNHILSFVPGRFTLVIDKISKVQSLCDKYFLSFYSLDAPHTVETAKKYTMNSRTWNSQIFDKTRNVLYNPHLFIRDAVSLARMEHKTIDALRSCDLISAPFLGLFTDECEQLKESLRIITEWISYDRQYPTFVKNDLGDLEKKKAELLKVIKAQKHKLHMSQYRVKSLQAERARLAADLDGLKEKEAELLVEDETLIHELNQLKIDLEIKEFRKEEVRRERREGLVSEAEAQMQTSQLQEKMRIIRSRIPSMERRQASLKSKIEIIEEKHRRLRDVDASLNETVQLSAKLRAEVSEDEFSLEQLEKTMDCCIDIFRLKTAPDVLGKIFHGMPLETRRAQEANTQKLLQQVLGSPVKSLSAPSSSNIRGEWSPRGESQATSVSAATANLEGSAFDQCCLLVAHKIERDWKRLYRALPFVPQRGRETIDKDIHELESSYIGESLFECAWRALQRWRRFHRRAKLSELRSAVARMRRADVVQELDDFLRPEEAKINQETPVPKFLSDELVPYYRQVERFDELRASAQPLS